MGQRSKLALGVVFGHLVQSSSLPGLELAPFQASLEAKMEREEGRAGETVGKLARVDSRTPWSPSVTESRQNPSAHGNLPDVSSPAEVPVSALS